jgi:aspartokinase
MSEQAIVGIGSEPAVVPLRLTGIGQPGAVDRVLREFLAARVELRSIARTGDALHLIVAADAAAGLASLFARLIGEGVVAGVDVGAPAAPVSVLGARIGDRLSIAARMFRALSREGIDSDCLSTSDARIWCLVGHADRGRALDALHQEFVEELARLKEGQIGL